MPTSLISSVCFSAQWNSRGPRTIRSVYETLMRAAAAPRRVLGYGSDAQLISLMWLKCLHLLIKNQTLEIKLSVMCLGSREKVEGNSSF